MLQLHEQLCVLMVLFLSSLHGSRAKRQSYQHQSTAQMLRLFACSYACSFPCRAYNKLTSSALKWQTETPSETVSLKQAIANKALKGLGALHQKVTANTTATGGHASSPAVIPPPVAPLPWTSQ